MRFRPAALAQSCAVIHTRRNGRGSLLLATVGALLAIAGAGCSSAPTEQGSAGTPETMDLTLVQCDGPRTMTGCGELDMGTPFDFFDPRANTDHPGLAPAQRDHARLRLAMERHGFANYPMEWWHYTFRREPEPEIHHDIPLR